MKREDAITLFRRSALLFSALLLAGVAFAATPSELVIYRFPISLAGGATPEGTLVSDAAGNFYGTTSYGGAFSQGGVFELSRPTQNGTPWNETLLYSFTGGNDGGGPAREALILDAKGNLYGTTAAGGSSGLGVVFQLAPPATDGGQWTENVLYSFRGGSSDGAAPWSGVVFDGAGNLYGTTTLGIAGSQLCRIYGCGTVYELSPPASQGGTWTETVLHGFVTASEPIGVPILDEAGNLYGTATDNGPAGGGIAYKLSPPATQGGKWNFSILYSFQYAFADPNSPQAALTLNNGALYGTTLYGGQSGGGAVFQLLPPSPPGGPWTENTLYSFGASAGDGFQSYSPVTFDKAGNLYATNAAGGDAVCDCGTVFELSPPATQGGNWTETILHAFTGNPKDGAQPLGGVVFGKYGGLFGTTQSGIGHGTAYEVTP